MASTTEKRVKDEIKKILKKHNAYWHMPVSNGMGAPTLDFVACHEGLFIGIEAKAPGKVATERQQLTMRTMEQAGGKTMVIDGERYPYHQLEAWLALVTAQKR